IDGHRQPSAFVYQLIPVTITNAANVPTAVGQQVNPAYNFSDIGPYFLGWETIGGQRYIVLTNVLKQLITTSFDTKSSSFGTVGESYLDVVSFASGTTLYTNTYTSHRDFAVTTGAPTYLSDINKAAYYISLARKVARLLIEPVGGSICTGA